MCTEKKVRKISPGKIFFQGRRFSSALFTGLVSIRRIYFFFFFPFLTRRKLSLYPLSKVACALFPVP